MQLPWRKPPAAMVRALSGWVATQSRRDHSPSKQGLSMSRRRLSLLPALLFLACASSALAESGRGQRAGVNASVKEIGRVEMWRGSSRFGLSVAAPFVWRCPSNLAITPFPHPAHRTGRADLPHPALGQDTHAFAHERSCTEPLISSASRVTHAVILTAAPSQPPMRPLGPTPASRIKVRVLPSLRHLTPSATPVP